jgi:hypothetical protein
VVSVIFSFQAYGCPLFLWLAVLSRYFLQIQCAVQQREFKQALQLLGEANKSLH